MGVHEGLPSGTALTSLDRLGAWVRSHRARDIAMLRRQLVGDVVAAVLFLLGVAAGLPISVLVVLLVCATSITALLVIRVI
jgi:hypothetical protein